MSDRDDEEPRHDDVDRDAILGRRQRLVSLALAGLASAVIGCDTVDPGPCLSVACPPEECEPLDAGPGDAGEDGGAQDAGTIVIRDGGPGDEDAETGDADAGEDAG